MARKTLRIFGSLSAQFLVAGGLVMAVAAYVLGTLVSDRIEQGVVQNSGVAAALYIDSLLPRKLITAAVAEGASISDMTRLALRDAFNEGILSDSVVTYNVWSREGEVIASFRPELLGQKFEPSAELLKAWSGEVSSQFETLEIEADHPEKTLGIPLLEVYLPIRDTQTDEILTVVEFYQRAEGLAADLKNAKRDSWVLVLQIFGLSGSLLFIIVHGGSLLIEKQRRQVKSQLVESRELSTRNELLRQRVTQAAQRSTAQSEKIMQRIGQDLHDGVAQHLSLASLRLEGAGMAASEDADTVRQSLANAMKELRAISRGLALPDLGLADLAACAKQAVNDHNKAFGSDAVLDVQMSDPLKTSYATKLCVYRFLQETLANASRHAKATRIKVVLDVSDRQIAVTVADNGRGFDIASQAGLREDGGQGLPSLADRAATLNGQVKIETKPGVGTEIRLVLPVSKETA